MNKLFQRYARRLSSIIIILLFGISLWQLAAAGWIQGKAIIAQQLLNYSWNRTLAGPESSSYSSDKAGNHRVPVQKPWPWADTWPVAKLIVPEQQVAQIILAGDNGSSLAFGPGLSLAGAMPNTSGMTLISGHRDTHFEFLKDIQINDLLYLETAEKIERYQVVDLQIVDSKSYKLQSSIEKQALVLATCYPFDAVTPGGPLRYLVFANIHPVKASRHRAETRVVDTPESL